MFRRFKTISVIYLSLCSIRIIADGVASFTLGVMPPPPHGTRYVTIHGHFYQPPRENPWLEAVETQDSAAPYHDWNERITSECYATNGAARMVDGDNRIIRIMNNYARMSFNFGPTLLSWLEQNAPRVYSMIRAADKLSQQHFGGHGSAIAQVYNHLIMPLASTSDKITQIRWGIADFEYRFHRKPEGMWLAETAVDFESLDLLAQHGIRYTILAPNQCARVRRIDDQGNTWYDTPDASVDTSKPYLVRLKDGRSIAVFFYNGVISRAIAFEGLLNSGESLAGRLATGFSSDTSQPQLVHVATDGESYGHHHRYGEMALAYALQSIEESGTARLTNYGEFLSLFPPTSEAVVHDNTSWSCFHGIERWRSDCGCSGGKAGWNQKWRAPLRESLDWLRDTLAPFVHALGNALLTDADAARNDYIRVVLARSTDHAKESVERFFAAHATRQLSSQEQEQALQLMELERHAQLMYTSCGWFFDEISGIETVQIIAYACRVIELATLLFGAQLVTGPLAAFQLKSQDRPYNHALPPTGLSGTAVPITALPTTALPVTAQSDFSLSGITLEDAFVGRLSQAKSNVPELEDGGNIYARLIQPLRVGLEQVAAHYAISSVFSGSSLHDAGAATHQLYCYTVENLDRRTHHYGAGQVTLGRVRIQAMLTGSTGTFAYAVLHFGDQNLTAAVKQFSESDAPALTWLKSAIEKAVVAADLPEVVRLIDGYFGESAYSLVSLFTDEQRRILQRILQPTLDEVEFSMTAIHREHASLLQFLSRAGLPKPGALNFAAQIAVNSGLRRALEQEPIDSERILELLEIARAEVVILETDRLGLLADQRMKHAMVNLQHEPADNSALTYALSLARTLHALPFGLNLWQAQNLWYELYLQGENIFRASAAEEQHGRRKGRATNHAALERWRQIFPELGRQLNINVDRLVPETLATTGAVTDNWQPVPAEPPRRNRRWDDIKHEMPAAITQHLPVAGPESSKPELSRNDGKDEVGELQPANPPSNHSA
jgi:alpha-amylase/alpha-mannosidase (GH57 family)